MLLLNERKAALRRQYLALRREIEPAQKAVWDRRIAQALADTVRYRNAETLLLYASLPHEVDTWALLRRAWAEGRRTALPRCADGGEMDFFLVRSEDALVRGRWGISEPNDSCPLYTPGAADVCLVPALAYDRRGYRLGYGGGYYDRYLVRIRVPTIGVCYPCFLSDELPAEAFDIRIEQILTGTILQGGVENA